MTIHTVEQAVASCKRKGIVFENGKIIFSSDDLHKIGNKTWGRIDFLRKEMNARVCEVDRKGEVVKFFNFGDNNKRRV